jgi:hypothetical protein
MFVKRRLAVILVAGLAMCFGLGAVLDASPADNDIKLPKLEFREVKLDNGLRVILVPDHSAPVYSIDVCYNVGSRNERPGRTGFAHLFEHMMFQGSENVGKGEHFIQVLNNGGGMNGTTNEDRTTYFEELPKNQLDLGLFLEADRMKSLNITQANLDNQRNAVQEERRQGIDNQPYGRAELDVDNLSYDNFAYKHSTIGSMSDLNAATVQDVSDFFRIYYAPNNAVLTLVAISMRTKRWRKSKNILLGFPRNLSRRKCCWMKSRTTASAARLFTIRWRACRRSSWRTTFPPAIRRKITRCSNWRSFWAEATARAFTSTW